MTGHRFFREYPYRDAYLLREARLFRAELTIPLILLGGITNRTTMDLAMAEGFGVRRDGSGAARRARPGQSDRGRRQPGAVGVHTL